MFDAVNELDKRYVSYLGLPPAKERGSEEAAAATAAHLVLTTIYPLRKPSLDAALELSLSSIPSGRDRDAGVAVGRMAAAAALQRKLFEGVETDPYRPAGEVGRFVPQPTCLRALVPSGAALLPEVLGPGHVAATSANVERASREGL
jgi:hypothetical protein